MVKELSGLEKKVEENPSKFIPSKGNFVRVVKELCEKGGTSDEGMEKMWGKYPRSLFDEEPYSDYTPIEESSIWSKEYSG